MKKIIRLTESDLNRIVRRVLRESMWTSDISWGKLTTKDDKPKRGRPPGTPKKDSETEKKTKTNNFQNKEKKEKHKSEISKYINSNDIKSRIQLKDKAPTLYQRALRYKLLDELFGTKKSKEELKKELFDFVKDNNIKLRAELHKLSSTWYSRALEWGLLDELFPPDQRFKKNK